MINSDFKCVGHCGIGYYTKTHRMYPPVYDSERKGWKLDENGVIFQDLTKPEIEVPQCDNCGSVLL